MLRGMLSNSLSLKGKKNVGSTTKKFVAALVCAANDKPFIDQHPKWRLVNRVRLYHELEARGYVWQPSLETWGPRQELVINGGLFVAQRLAITRPVNGAFLLRIMAEVDAVDDIHDELMELAGAIGWVIERSGPAFTGGENGDEWVSIKYVVKRG